MGLLATLLGLLGCDQRQIDEARTTAREAFNALKPDDMLFKGIVIGQSTEADILRQAGKPDFIWGEGGEGSEGGGDDGSRRLDYPRGPEGGRTWAVTIDANDLVTRIEQLLVAENFARVQPGMDQTQVRRILGRPGKTQRYPLKREVVWSWRWWERHNETAFFDVHFNEDGIVTGTGRHDDPRRELNN